MLSKAVRWFRRKFEPTRCTHCGGVCEGHLWYGETVSKVAPPTGPFCSPQCCDEDYEQANVQQEDFENVSKD